MTIVLILMFLLVCGSPPLLFANGERPACKGVGRVPLITLKMAWKTSQVEIIMEGR